MLELVLGLATAIGLVVMGSAVVGVAWYIYTRHPTPERSFREAVGELRWGFGIAVFVIPQGLVAYDEGLGFWGFYLGFAFLGLMLWMAWWWEI